MKKLNMLIIFLGTVIVFAALSVARGDDFSITSFSGNGELVFDVPPNATRYRVEWAPSPAGPWTNSWEHLNNVIFPSSSCATCSVAMCYRVVVNSIPEDMVCVPGGTNSGSDPDEGAYSLTVDTFYMDATEVTKARWDAVYSWAVTNSYSFDNAGRGKANDHPVQYVNWYDCVKWCNARSEKEGCTPCYTVSGNVYRSGQSSPDYDFSVNGYHLPTNDEWEYAARGGLSGKRFPWGDTISHSRANYYSFNSDSNDVSSTSGFHPDYDDGVYPMTSPVGDFAANGYGLYDMAGNVWEWCNDASGSDRCLRGGCWYDSANFQRCEREHYFSPALRDLDMGFRAVCR